MSLWEYREGSTGPKLSGDSNHTWDSKALLNSTSPAQNLGPPARYLVTASGTGEAVVEWGTYWNVSKLTLFTW